MRKVNAAPIKRLGRGKTSMMIKRNPSRYKKRILFGGWKDRLCNKTYACYCYGFFNDLI